MIDQSPQSTRLDPSEVALRRGSDDDVSYLLSKAISLKPAERQQLACEIFLLRTQQQELLVRFPAVHAIAQARAGSKQESDDSGGSEDQAGSSTELRRALAEVEQRFRGSRSGRDAASALLEGYHALAERGWSELTKERTLPFATATAVRAQQVIVESYKVLSETRRLYEERGTDGESVDQYLRRELNRWHADAEKSSFPAREQGALEQLFGLEDAHRMPFELIGRWSEQFLSLQKIIDRLSDRMYRGNIPLVVKFSKAYQGERALADVLQDASIGLTRAIRGFDASKGYQFSTYAVRCIKTTVERGAIVEGRKHKLSKSDWETISEMRRRFGGLVPANEDLLAASKEFRKSPSRLRTLLQRANGLGSTHNFTSLSGGEEKGVAFEDTLECSSSPASAQVESQDLLVGLRALLSHLSDRERLVIEHRYGLLDGEPKTLEEIGAIVGVSKERIRQIQEELLLTLRVGIQHGIDAFLSELNRRQNRPS